jgi:transposase
VQHWRIEGRSAQLKGSIMVEKGNAQLALVDHLPAIYVPICALVADGSPRLAGQDLEHIKALAQVESKLPPILVHRHTMRVIDGLHRLRAAEICGRTEIEVRFFEGDDNAAFVLAVQSNIAHGLPLTLADRTSAAARIVISHPHWSDRAVANVVGLSATTVAAIRERSAPESLELDARIGRDGKSRPANSAAARRRTRDLIAANPAASLREIAREAGVSPATVQDVRKRLERGDDPVPPQQRRSEKAGRALHDAKSAGVLPDRHKASQAAEIVLEKLRRDPSLRLSEAGRDVLIWLGASSLGISDWSNIIDQIPPHCFNLVAQLACSCAQEWGSFANELKLRSQAG